MDNGSLHNIARSLENVAGGILERLRHEGQNASRPFEALEHAVDREVLRLRGEGQFELADALAKLRDA